jgi:hypothetical protein
VIYFIDLITAQRGKSSEKPELKKITFVCTIQHLQALVWQLRAATRQLEAIANSTR